MSLSGKLTGRPPRRRGLPLLLAFLLVTLGLSLWLGFQAVGAAASHRRTAEGVLRDYGEIAVAEYSRRVQDGLDRFFRRAFDEVPWRVRREPPPAPRVLEWEFEEALDRVNCQCRDLRERVVFLASDLHSGVVRALPESFPMDQGHRASNRVEEVWLRNPSERIGFATAPAGAVLEGATGLFYNVSLEPSGEEGQGRAIYVILAPLAAVGELFRSWYLEKGLLPEAVAGSQPNDSVLHLGVKGPGGLPVFRSPRYEGSGLVARDTLPPEYGSLVVEAAIHTNAASSLVIGGLPRARLPLLLALMALTLGIGAAAVVQIRREQDLARLRDDFISGVSHEFRTPLTQLRMFTELLADGKLRTDEERTRSTRVINREARRLTHLVENILFFSRMGRTPLRRAGRERVPVREAFQDLAEAFTPLAQGAEATMETNVDPPGLTIEADRGGLHQMLANLLDNALKYGPRGQTVRLTARVDGDRLRITVDDEGPGIPTSERERIWDPYTRLNRDMSGDVQGSGIGLAVVAELAEFAGGCVRVEEAPGGGARFVVELSRAAPAGASPPSMEEE